MLVADPGRVAVMGYFLHRVKDGVHRQHAHRKPLIFLGPLVALLTGFHGELDGKFNAGVIQSCQVQLRVDNLKVGGSGNIPGADRPRPLGFQAHLTNAAAARPGQRRADADALDVQEQVHHLLLHPRNRAVFVHHIEDFHLGDGAALDGTEQNAPQGIADSIGIALRQGAEGYLSVGLVAFQHVDAGPGYLLGVAGRQKGERFQHTGYLE